MISYDRHILIIFLIRNNLKFLVHVFISFILKDKISIKALEKVYGVDLAFQSFFLHVQNLRHMHHHSTYFHAER